MQDGERIVPLHFEVRGQSLRSSPKKETVIVTDPWRVLSEFVSVLVKTNTGRKKAH